MAWKWKFSKYNKILTENCSIFIRKIEIFNEFQIVKIHDAVQDDNPLLIRSIPKNRVRQIPYFFGEIVLGDVDDILRRSGFAQKGHNWWRIQKSQNWLKGCYDRLCMYVCMCVWRYFRIWKSKMQTKNFSSSTIRVNRIKLGFNKPLLAV